MKTGIELIAEERQRQILQERWTPEHDDIHDKGQMAGAAAVYALESCGFENPHCIELKREDVTHNVRLWPWPDRWWKPADRIRNLTKAGALIAAEIDRLNRQSQTEAAPDFQHPAGNSSPVTSIASSGM